MKKFLVSYYFFLVLFLSFFCSGIMDSQDGLQYLSVARNIFYTGKPTMQPYEYPKNNIHMSTYVGKNGDSYSPTGLGYSLALVPAVAATDIVYRIYNVKPPVHFPLENDWLILLMASLTNIFFAAGLAIILYLYFSELGLSKRQSLVMSLISIFATNLLVYAKNSFAHMMFVFFLTLSFFMIKKYFASRKKRFLIFAGLSYGVVTITYNASYLLSLPPLLAYFILLQKPKLKLNNLFFLFKDLLCFFAGLAPFILIYIKFENLRSGNQLTDPGLYISYAKSNFFHVPISIFFEGLYGQLFSPGRSIFIYSPILLIIILFWHKIRATIIPELIVFILMALLYVPFFATQVVWGDGGKLGVYGFTSLWHGESSWGPRYLILLIPFGLLVVGNIFQRLSKIQRYLIFYPLVAIGLYIEILGVVMPYQIKVYNLERSFNVNQTEFTSYVYSNLIPRYTPILSMSKNLVKLAAYFPKTLDHGIYNVKLYDGINIPFNVGPERWRVIEGKGFVSFDDSKKDPIRKISFGLINHPILESSSSASVQFILNGHSLLQRQQEFAPKERNIISIPINAEFLKDKDNQLLINVTFTPPTKDNGQIFSIIAFSINNKVINLESLDFPYVSNLGPAMVGATYQNYGNINKDPWRFWDLHTQVYEKTPDFWWIKAMYYWDYPKKALAIIFTIAAIAMLSFGYKTITYYNKVNGQA